MTLNITTEHGDGVLTTDHAASSYGLPVVVVGGTAYGPADLAMGVNTGTFGGDDADAAALVESARRAGYRVYC